MNEFELALAIGAIATVLIARGLPRANWWVAAFTVAFVISAGWWKLGIPYHPAATLMVDALVCLAIYIGAQERWELHLYQIFRLSALVSLLKLMGFIPADWLYAVALEACNWAALLTVTGTAILNGARDGGRGADRHWLPDLRGARRTLRSARTTEPWTKVRR